MTFILHREYRRSSLVGAFDDTELSGPGEIVVLPDALLWFVFPGDSDRESQLPSPSTVVWRPNPHDYDPKDCESLGLPQVVEDAYAAGDRIHHVFLCRKDDDFAFYAGIAELSFLGRAEVHLSLAASKLPRERWVQFGGYSGWLVELDHVQHIVPAGDLDTFAALIDQFFSTAGAHAHITRYEGNSLTIHLNSKLAWLMYSHENVELYVSNPLLGSEEQHFVCDCGIPLSCPARQTVSHQEAAAIARFFFANGNVPSDFTWREFQEA